jgi:parallel beta-helix repeat protein
MQTAVGWRKNLHVAVVCLVALAVTPQIGAGRTVQFHVSDQGKDQWPGTSAKPFVSLVRARDAVRELRLAAGGELKHPVEIVAHGELAVLQPLILDKSDSGTKKCTITYTAAKNSKFVGGKVLRDFGPVTDADALALLDENARAKVVQIDLKALGITNFGSPAGGGMELFFNDKPMTLARWPNEGFTKIVGVLTNQPNVIHGRKGDLVGDILYEGDRPSRWLKEQNPWVHGYWFWDWAEQRQQIEAIEPGSKLIKIKAPYHHYGYRRGQYYYAYNLLSEIDCPGEWYADRAKGVLYFWPPGDPVVGRTVVSVAESVIKAEGISNVRFEKMLVEAARGNAIEISNGSQVEISGCTVRNTGGCAISVSGGDNCTVRECEVYNLGRGGISVSGGDRTTLTPANHQVIRCHVHDYGRIIPMGSAGVGVFGVGNRVASCRIHDAPHQAICFSGNNNVMEYNEMFRVCRESNDAGAIYAGRDWTMLDNQIRHNYLHDIRGFENNGCVGVYLDDFFCGTTIYGNVFKNVSRAAMVGGGNYNIIENNLFIDCDPCIHLDARGEGWAKTFFEGKDTSDTSLQARMKAVDYKSKYYARYQWLQSAMDEPNPGHPRGNKYNRNVGIGGVWEAVEKIARPGNEFEANTITTNRGLLTTNRRTGIPDLTKEAYRKTGLKPLPTGEMGLASRVRALEP